MGFSRQEYWSGLTCPPSRDLPDPQIKPGSPALQVNYLPSEPQGSLGRQIDGERTWAGGGQAEPALPAYKGSQTVGA